MSWEQDKLQDSKKLFGQVPPKPAAPAKPVVSEKKDSVPEPVAPPVAPPAAPVSEKTPQA
ncbi:MAG: hypothetical protein NTY53_24090 [Kiritimatiellaeota bacterium]|nr:hypothetical protein [Kiritimatiellota bacterium]